MNGAGLAISFVVVPGFIFCIRALMRRGVFGAFTARKVIHIGVAHWWLIAMAMFDDPWTASVGPACSLLATALPTARPLLPRGKETGTGWDRGTFFYSLSLLILVNLSWRGVLPPRSAGIGVLVMAWGDACAGLVGAKLGGRGVMVWGRRKTVAGTAAMLCVSFVVALVLTIAWIPRPGGLGTAALTSLAIAGGAAVLEVLTPFEMDNLTVSVGAALLSGGLFA